LSQAKKKKKKKKKKEKKKAEAASLQSEKNSTFGKCLSVRRLPEVRRASQIGERGVVGGGSRESILGLQGKREGNEQFSRTCRSGLLQQRKGERRLKGSHAIGRTRREGRQRPSHYIPSGNTTYLSQHPEEQDWKPGRTHGLYGGNLRTGGRSRRPSLTSIFAKATTTDGELFVTNRGGRNRLGAMRRTEKSPTSISLIDYRRGGGSEIVREKMGKRAEQKRSNRAAASSRGRKAGEEAWRQRNSRQQ